MQPSESFRVRIIASLFPSILIQHTIIKIVIQRKQPNRIDRLIFGLDSSGVDLEVIERCCGTRICRISIDMYSDHARTRKLNWLGCRVISHHFYP